MDEKNSENSDGNFGNFGAGAKVFAPPSDGAGINAPRENAEKPQFHGDTYAKIAAAEEANGAGNPANGSQNLANFSRESQTQTQTQNPQNQTNFVQKSNKLLPKWARILTLVFAIISAIYFGVVVLINVANLISAISVMMNSDLSGGSSVVSPMQVISTIVSVALFFCVIILLWASIRLCKFDNAARGTWLKIGAATAVLIFVPIGISIYSLNEMNKFYTDATTGLTQACGDEQISAMFNLDCKNSDDFGALSTVIAPIIRNLIVANIVPLGLIVFGWIILTRKSVKNWFS